MTRIGRTFPGDRTIARHELQTEAKIFLVVGAISVHGPSLK